MSVGEGEGDGKGVRGRGKTKGGVDHGRVDVYGEINVLSLILRLRFEGENELAVGRESERK